jgi:ribosomal protein S6--L-glutamate ligase
VSTWVLTDSRYLEQRMPLALIDWLRAAGHAPRVIIADELMDASWTDLAPGDLVVSRSRHPLAPTLLDDAVARGARTLNPPRAVERVRDKAACAMALASGGLPVPRTRLVRGPADLADLPASAFPLVVKPVYGDNARGVQIVPTRKDLVALRLGEGLHLAQAYVDAGGVDIKLYVAGDEVWATRRPSPLLDSGAPGVRMPVTPGLRSIADGCRREFGLTLFGVDVLESDEGLAIVDVNEFPNYTGLPKAPEAIGELLVGAA